MKIVVLDDEKRVCELVCALVLWDELNLELAGTANDGLEGLNLIKEVNPDIVITDIRMPSMDGLELIEKAKEFNPDLQFIIISGYRQFDYAKKAIKFGVSDYLLKPLNQIELTESLKKMIKIHDEKIKSKCDVENRDQLRQYFLRGFIESSESEDNFQTFFDPSEKIITTIINCDGEFYKYDDKAIEVIRTKIKDVFFLYLDFVSDWDLIYVPSFHCFVMFVSYKMEQEEMLLPNLQNAFKDAIVNFANLYQNLELTFNLGESVYDVSLIKESFWKVRNSSISRINNKHGRFNMPIDEKFSIDEDVLHSVFLKIRNLSIDERLNSELLNEQLLILDRLNINTFFLTVEILTTSLQKFYKSQLQDEYEGIDFERIYFSNERTQIIEILREQIEFGYSKIINKLKSENVKPIRDAQLYLSTHYAEDQLSLDYISEVVHLSPTYFSALFKKETGQGFLEYLKELRINKSKELLASTTLPIKEISEKVGYHDSRHFSKCFKKQLGLKPQDYRKLYG
jgi:two-component system response regulator YesN